MGFTEQKNNRKAAILLFLWNDKGIELPSHHTLSANEGRLKKESDGFVQEVPFSRRMSNERHGKTLQRKT
jgi:hypothetical protein